MNQGIITKINKNLYSVLFEDTIFICEQSGKLFKNNIKPTVGDYVEFNKNTLRIEKLLLRKNSLVRPLISNIEKLLIITSVHLPKFSLYLIDKMLITSLSKNIEPIIVFTKEDLISFKDKLKIIKYKKYYRALGYKVYSNTQLDKIKKEFESSVIALTGQTGAGKSTLLNRIDNNLNLKTDVVSLSLGRGKHTTRIVELYQMFGGLVADTPGFSSLELEICAEDIKKYYKEFDLDCKYKSCSHVKEEGCKVKLHLGKNKIFDQRYQNYLKLISEVEKC